MKKFLFLLSVLIFPSIGLAQNMTFDDGTTWNCDQNFSPVPLRYNYQYRFYDTWNNNSNRTVYMNTYAVRYKNSSYMRMGQNWPNGKSVYWTNALVNGGYRVPAYSNMQILSTYTNDWAILNHPATRTNNDFTIAYKVTYDFSNNYPDASDDSSHVECQPYYITWCGDGVRDSGYEQCDPNDLSRSGWGSGGCGPTCQPVTAPPSCTSLTVTPSTGNAPLNVALSCAGVSATSYRIDIRSSTGVIRTITTQNGTHTFTSSGNYTATCYVNSTVTSTACQRSIAVTPLTPTTFDLALKKYVNSVTPANDAQTPAAAVAIAPNTNFTYVIRVTNNGPATANGVTTVTDPGPSPAGVTVTGVSGTGWTCTRTGNSISCNRSTTLASGATFPDIIVSARTSGTVGIFTNTATVANSGDTNPANNTDPANVRVGTITPLVHIDKRDANPLPNDLDGVVGNDTQTVYIGSGAMFRIRVTNTGSENLTTIRLVDAMAPNCSGAITLPSTRPATWSNFAAGSGVTTDAIFAPGEWFEYTCTRANTAAGGYTNSATVTASGAVSGTTVTATDATIVLTGPVARCASLTPSQGTTNVSPNTAITYTCASAGYTGLMTNLEYNISCGTGDATATWTGSATRVCNAPNAYLASQTISCSVRDRTVPTVVFSGSAVGACVVGVTTGGGGGGGAAYVGKKCVNNIATCATYNSIFACTNDGIPSHLCYSADATGYNSCQNQYLDCGGGGGGGGGGCGNGVLEGGEECDVVGAPWCENCRLKLDTIPGENPIVDLWMTIPTLSRVNLGYSWLDGENGKMKFQDNRMVLGVGTKAFTLADTVGFGIRTRYMLPLMIEADKLFCLASSGDSLNAQKICTTAGANTTGLETWTRYDGKKYVILGKGDYQVPQPDRRYTVARANSNNNIVLFRGPGMYTVAGRGGVLTLNSAFWGSSIGTDGTITLSTLDSATRTTAIDLVSLSVRVSGALVGTTNTPVNRSIESFVNQVGISEFLSSIRVNSTTTSINTTSSSSSSISPVQVSIAPTGNKTATRLEDIPVLNGNQNVRAVKGDLTINCPSGSTAFVMEGVRTILVEGNIIFNCNTTYSSSDATSSWAWIAKGGNIHISNGVGTLSEGAVTNLAGVYVAIGESGHGGNITYSGNATTQKILKIEGSLYGNATGLFNSRLYARGTSAYEILTTGTIITYSNRALVNPPPLLSQYLNNYNVERVIR